MIKLQYEIKTHKVNREYEQPHFFILNKGLNSGKPLRNPCPNCFVLITETEEQRETLFYICLSLKIRRCFEYYLKGSVIPFICIIDTRKVFHIALQDFQEKQWNQKIQKLKIIIDYESNLKLQLKTISDLKMAVLRS